jgi:hypothetical protein
MAEASALMPYDYTRLLFAAIIGWIFFAEVPDLWTWVGAAVIVGAALYIAHREAVLKRAEGIVATATEAAASAGDPTLSAPAAERRP